MATKPIIKDPSDIQPIVEYLNAVLADGGRKAAIEAQKKNFKNIGKTFEAQFAKVAKQNGIKLDKKISRDERKNIDDLAWEEYKKIYARLLPDSQPLQEYDKTEFLLYFYSGKLGLWNPRGTETAYLKGDVATAGTDDELIGQPKQIQVKKVHGRFRIDYSVEGLLRQVEDYAESFSKESLIKLYGVLKANENWLADKELSEPVFKNKIQFMQRYAQLSAAEWYLFYIPKFDFWLSVHKNSLANLVEAFRGSWVLDKLITSSKKGWYTNQLRFKGYGSLRTLFKIPILPTIYSFIHSPVPQLFYQTRGVIRKGVVVPTSAVYNVDKIEQYNAQTKNNGDFWDIHNSFFQPIVYK